LAEGLFARKSVSLTEAAFFGSLAALSTVIVPARIQPYVAVPCIIFTPLSARIPDIASGNGLAELQNDRNREKT
jgi:hypothetical protein